MYNAQCIFFIGPRSASSPNHAHCFCNLSSLHPHPPGSFSLPVPRSPSVARPLLARASRAPRSLVAALAALTTPTLTHRRAICSRNTPLENCGHRTRFVDSPSLLPPTTTNPPSTSSRRRHCRRPIRWARTPPPPLPSHDLPAGLAPLREYPAPVFMSVPEPPQLVRLPGAVKAFQPGVSPLLPRP